MIRLCYHGWTHDKIEPIDDFRRMKMRMEMPPTWGADPEPCEVWSVEVVRDLDNGNALVALKEPERKTVLLDTPWVVWLCEGEAILLTSSEPPLYTNEHWFKLRSSADQFYAEMKKEF